MNLCLKSFSEYESSICFWMIVNFVGENCVWGAWIWSYGCEANTHWCAWWRQVSVWLFWFWWIISCWKIELLNWLISNADLGMRLLWRIRRGGGGISYSRGFDPCLVLECEISLKVCVVEFDFCFLFIWFDLIGLALDHFIVKDEVSFAMISAATYFWFQKLSCLLPWMILARCMSNLRFDLSSLIFTCYSYPYPWW